jgi:RHS repeat-associated protein
MTEDQNKGITTITYNHLNLPVQISFASGDGIKYLYDATGQKVAKTVTVNSSDMVTDYLDGYQYTNEVLNFFPHAEGYVNVTYCQECETEFQQRFNYVYQYKDHLGNIRLNYGFDEVEQVIKIIEENHYYPFGLKHLKYNTGMKQYGVDEEFPELMELKQVPAGVEVMNKYKYNGKEYQDELGLNMYDYGARNYDPDLGRWMNMDPLAEKFSSWSQYNYCVDNPVLFVDTDGKDIIVLSYGKNENSGSSTRHPNGHQAILVGDDKKGWKYYSLDGDVVNGEKNNNYTIAEFKTLKEFSTSEHNTFKSDYDDGKGTENSEKSGNGEIKQRYAEGYMIQTTAEQDKDMNAAAEEVTEGGHDMMNVLGYNNCTAVPEAALDAAGLKNGEWTPHQIYGGPPTPNFTPNAKQAEIERANEGKDVDDKLKRQ